MKTRTMLRGRNVTMCLFFIGAWVLCRAVSLQAQDVCGTKMPDYEAMRVSDPEAYARAMRFEEQVKVYTRLLKDKERAASVQEEVIRIPVVVHVLYNTPEQNISDAQIESQLVVLNRDFRAMNEDKDRVPEEFSSLVADVGVEFYLACTDPDGNPTSGIVRVPTDTEVFDLGEAQEPSLGGVSGWPCEQYLNIWTCRLPSSSAGTLLGYANNPFHTPRRYCSMGYDGVAMNYRVFGFYPQNPFDRAEVFKGRSATHEVGHWLGLNHIWGRGSGGCGLDDLVEDTPVQAGPNYGCPDYPVNSCTGAPGNDMFMNHMDYSDGRCLYMFSVGQKARMRMALEMFRPTFLSADLLCSNLPDAALVFGTATNITHNMASVPVRSDKPGTLHYVVLKSEGPAPWNFAALHDESGVAEMAIPTADTDVTLLLSGLTPSTDYKVHGILADGAGGSATATSGVKSSVTFATEAVPPVGVEGEDMESLTLFPNPVDGVLELEGVDSYEGLEVYDLSGALVYSQEEGSRIDLRHLPAGAYLVRVHTADGLRAVRILK